MNMEKSIKNLSKTTGMTWKRNFLKVVLGEFNRVDDGKPCNDEQCIKVIKKLIKNSKEILKFRKNDVMALRELELLKTLLPVKKEASESYMQIIIDGVMLTHEYKNVMQLMKPCIEDMTLHGFDVDKGKLSQLLKNS